MSLICITHFAGAQDLFNILMNKGNKAYNQLQFQDALSYYKQSYAKSSANRQVREAATERIADCYWLLRNYDSAYVWYEQVPLTYPDPNGKIKYRKAELNAIAGNYSKASSDLIGVYGYSERAAGFLRVNKMKRDSADWSLNFLNNINTNYFREFSPVLMDSGMVWATNQPKRLARAGVMGWDNMGYARMIQVDDTVKLKSIQAPDQRKLFDKKDLDPKGPEVLAMHHSGADVEQLKRSPIPKGLKEKAKSIDSITDPVKGIEKFSYNLAHATYSKATGKVYFSANRQDKLKGDTRTVGIVEADRDGDRFSNARFTLDLDREYSSMHPAIHPDGQTLVYSSNRQGGKGGYDLYYVVKESDRTWSTPVLVAGVNTIGNELFASFAPDGTLYFSSDGLPGLGGLDVYKATFKNGRASQVEHVSFPLNSAYDDFGMSFNEDGKTGYFTSDRLGTDDIFGFVYDKKKPQVTGRVISEAMARVVPGVKIRLYELDDNGKPFVVDSAITNDEGKYLLQGRPNRDYTLDAIYEGGQQTVAFNTNKEYKLKTLDDIIIRDKKPEQPKPAVVVPQVPDTFRYIVYFDFDKANIDREAKAVLEEVVAKLNEDATYKVSLYGHTDEAGKDRYNDRLSDRRSRSVANFLKKADISKSRIYFESFGERVLAVLNADKRNARLNRRVEITISK